jgi:hypothetical protein
MLTIANTVLPPEPASVARARHLVGEVTKPLPRRAREAAELVADELATHCVVHAGTDFEVFAAVDDDSFEVVVSDGTGWSTRPRKEPGHGLLLVGLLASAWAAELEGDGKRVWARLIADDVPLN